MRLTQRNSFWSQLEQIYFTTEFKSPNKTDLQICGTISLQTMCIKFCLNVGNLLCVKNAWTGSRIWDY